MFNKLTGHFVQKIDPQHFRPVSFKFKIFPSFILVCPDNFRPAYNFVRSIFVLLINLVNDFTDLDFDSDHVRIHPNKRFLIEYNKITNEFRHYIKCTLVCTQTNVLQHKSSFTSMSGSYEEKQGSSPT